MSVTQIPFCETTGWEVYSKTGNIEHNSKKFFSVRGLQTRIVSDRTMQWEQPIITQPEVGILGIVTRVYKGTRYFLIQAKYEPGNIGLLQISPTVQATHSNYSRVHKGKVQPYLRYFTDTSSSKVLCDRLLSEQNSRFYRKFNRNMIVEVSSDLDLLDNYYWVTLAQLGQLYRVNNLVNMDTRSVLSNISLFRRSNYNIDIDLEQPPFNEYSNKILGSFSPTSKPSTHLNEILSLLRTRRKNSRLISKLAPLQDIHDWVTLDDRIHHVSQSYFDVISVRVETNCREVTHWCQPLIRDTHLGLVGFVSKMTHGVLHFLAHMKIECGNRNTINIAPTVACSNYKLHQQAPNPPPFLDLLVDASTDQIMFDEIQSEEGGRFFQVQNIYRIVEIPEDIRLELPVNYFWVTLSQLVELLDIDELSIDTRSLLSRLVVGLALERS